MPAPGVLLLITVVLIVLALVYYLVSVIFALRRITAGLDTTISAVVEIIKKSEPVNAIVPSIAKIRDAARAGSKDLDAVPLLLTTQDQVIQTVQGVAHYGGSLDVILDDA